MGGAVRAFALVRLYLSKFIYRTDNRDGYKNLYLCDTLGNIDRITKVAADVEFVAENGEKIFYTSSEVSPAEKQLFSINVNVSRKGAVKFGTLSKADAGRGLAQCSVQC